MTPKMSLNLNLPCRDEKIRSIPKDQLTQRQVPLPQSINHFIRSAGLPDDTSEQISNVIAKIGKYLESKGIKHKIVPDLFIDSDYTDWREIELSVQIDKPLDIIYTQLKPEIYNLVSDALPESISEKTMVIVEGMLTEVDIAL